MARVVIVGAGLGGLAAAVTLARAGRPVLVLEAGEVAGGYAANFERGGYRFDASLHLLDAVEPGTPNRPVWEHLGLHRRVRTVTPDPVRLERWPDRDLRIGPGGWLEAFAEAFPDEREGARTLLRLADDVLAATVTERDERLAGRPGLALRAPLDRLLDRTAADVLRDVLSAPRAIGVAGALACYLGLGAEELGAIPFLAMFAGYERGASYVPGGSGAIARALADELAAHGGELRLGAPVTAVRCPRGQVRGVQIDGEEIETDTVIANLSPVLLYGRLVDRDVVERRFLARLDRMTLGTSAVKGWLGCKHDPAPGLPYEIFLRADHGTRFRDGAVDDLTVVRPHVVDPGCAPAGGAVFSVTIGAEARDDPDRAELVDAALDVLEDRLVPGLRDAIDARVVATPATFRRYTGNPGGTIHGFRPIPSQSGPRRLGVTGPVRGLLHAGGWTYAGSGFTPSMASGLVAAAEVLGGLPDYGAMEAR